MFAALPWYDFAEVADRTDALWGHLRRHLRHQGLPAPAALDRTTCPYALLREPDLLWSQICGYVVGGVGRDLVQAVATPQYAAPGCCGDDYRSAVVVPRDSTVAQLEDLRSARAVANEPLSHSGVNALRLLTAPLARSGRFFGSVRMTGSHVVSLQEVAAGRADVAAIDCVTFDLVARHRPALVQAVRVLCRTDPGPAPPWITGGLRSADELARLRRALAGLMADPAAASVRRELSWSGWQLPDEGRYVAMAWGGARAVGDGYLDFGGDEELPTRSPAEGRGGCAAVG